MCKEREGRIDRMVTISNINKINCMYTAAREREREALYVVCLFLRFKIQINTLTQATRLNLQTKVIISFIYM